MTIYYDELCALIAGSVVSSLLAVGKRRDGPAMNALSNRRLVQSFAILLCFVCVGSASLRAQTYTTAAGDAGNSEIWEQNSTWTPNTGFPNGTSNVANLAAVNSASTLDLNTVGVTVNSVNVLSGGTSSWTISNGQLTFAGATPGYSDQSSIGGNTISASVVLNANSTFNIGSTGGTTISGGISGSGVIKAGAGTLTLSGTNTYTGGTTVNGGTLQISSDSNLGDSSGGLTLNGGTLTFTGSTSDNRAISLGNSGGTISEINNSVVSIRGQITGNGPLNINADSGGGAAGLVFANTTSNTFTGLTTIQNGFVELGSSALALSGDVTVDSAGKLSVANANVEQIASTATLTVNGTFEFDGGSQQTIATLAGAGNINNVVTGGMAALIVSNGNFSGSINNGFGQMALTKQGSGTLTLAGSNNTYTGTTTVTGGTLIFTGDTSVMGSTITDNAAVVFNQTANSNFSQAITGSGTVTQQGTATLTLSGTNSYTGGTFINGGKLQITSDSNLGNATGGITLTNWGQLGLCF